MTVIRRLLAVVLVVAMGTIWERPLAAGASSSLARAELSRGPVLQPSSALDAILRRLTRSLHRRLTAPSLAPRSRTRAVDLQALALPFDSKWPKGTQPGATAQLTPAQLDGADKPSAATWHNTSYTAAGATGGLDQVATFPLDAAGDLAFGDWLATAYGTSTQAEAQVNDAVKFLTAHGQQDHTCNDNWPTCHIFSLSYSRNAKQYTAWYVVLHEAYLMGEVLVEAPLAAAQTNETVFDGAVTTLAENGNDTLATALGPFMKIATFELAHLVKGKLHSTKTLKPKEEGIFLVLVDFANQGALEPAATITFSQKRKVIGSEDMQVEDVNNSTMTFILRLTFKRAVRLTARATASLGPAQDHRSLTFTVKKKKT